MNSLYPIAGTTSDGRTVYFGKLRPLDPAAPHLLTYVHLDATSPEVEGYVPLIQLGLENPAYVPPGASDGHPLRERILARIAAHLAAIPADLVEAWSNTVKLAALGEPHPDIPACLACGHTPRDLAESTREALTDARHALRA